MSPLTGKRSLQAAVAILSLIPLTAGTAGVILGPGAVAEIASWPVDLDSHFRYLSGIFLGLGVVFLATVPGIERKTALFRLATALVVSGGCARLLSLLDAGTPSAGHLAGLGMELVVVPLLALWQARVARQHAGTAATGGDQTRNS